MSIIIISHKVKINPDNVATPMAGSVGDVGTLITLALVASFFYSYSKLIIYFLSISIEFRKNSEAYNGISLN